MTEKCGIIYYWLIISENLSCKDSVEYVIKYVIMWFPVIRYFLFLEFLPPNTIYEHLLYF